MSSRVTDSDPFEHSMTCVSYANDVQIGGVILGNTYPDRPAEYDELQQGVYNACFQEILDLAENFDVTCVED